MKFLILAILALAFVLPSEAGIVKQSYKHGIKPGAKAAVKSVKFLKRLIY